jgi:hypothetical protein
MVMTQKDAVYEAIKQLGGYATFGQLNQTALRVPNCDWSGTKTPFASIRRIVQQDARYFRIRPGLWGVLAQKEAILAQLQLPLDWQTAQNEQTATFDHGYYQGLLVEIGNLRHLQTFVPYQDKNRAFLGKSLSQITTLDKFHEFTYSDVLRRAITIDVTWFNARNFPDAFFEVEHSTDIQNSLLKFVELQDFYTRFYIVADSVREREHQTKLNYDAFSDIRSRVGFLAYEQVAKMHTAEYERAKHDAF